MIIKKQAFPRAALIGNPSDGYYGKTIAFVFDNYSAQVDLYETPELDFVPSLRDHSCFPNIRLRGLMAIPPICEKNGGNDKFFQEMFALAVDITAKKYDNVCVDTLSMGMSVDFVDAVRCGSTMIRVGTAIFGQRIYTKHHQ